MKTVALSALALALLASTAAVAGERSYTLHAAPDSEAWPEIDTALRQIVPEGGTITMNKSISTITVSGVEDFNGITDYLDQMNTLLSRQFEISTNILVVPADQAPSPAIILTDDQPRDIGKRFADAGKLLDYHTMNGVTSNGRAIEASLISELSYPLQVQPVNAAEAVPAAKINTGTRISVTPRYTQSGIRVQYRITSIPDKASTPTVALDGEYVAKDGQTIELTSLGKEAGAPLGLFTGDAKAAVVAISVKQIAAAEPSAIE